MMMNDAPEMLWSGFWRSVRKFPNRPALEVGGETLSYAQLSDKALRLASILSRCQPSGGLPLTAVFAYRSVTAFAGVISALFAGNGYVPLNRTFPVDRTRVMLERSGCRTLIIDTESETQLSEVLAGSKLRFSLIFPERDDAALLRAKYVGHEVFTCLDLQTSSQHEPTNSDFESVAYLLFTSGSTGIPKGVMISHRNVRHYLNFIVNRYGISENDRLSQMFDMTFDLSVHDMFVAWERGACLCCPDRKSLLSPGEFIKRSNLTVWFSVPSVGVFLKKLGGLKAGLYPNLRLLLFCGEALSLGVLKAWSAAAPNSEIENLYGPTELTIACMYYRWDRDLSPSESTMGIVPIGTPFPEMEARIVGSDLRVVDVGEDGELIMSGPQMALGYLNDPDKTRQAFVIPPGEEKVFYRTGDRVKQPARSPMIYLGRMDFQIKILGHRVEIGEIEAVVREESGIDGVVVLGWPPTPGGAGGVEVFIQSERQDTKRLSEQIATRLPSYMVPRRIHWLPELPLNTNGKYDRKALLARLQEEALS